MPPRGQLTVYLKDNADAQDVAQLRVVLETGKRICNLTTIFVLDDLREVCRRTVYHSTGFPPNFRFHSGERSRSR